MLAGDAPGARYLPGSGGLESGGMAWVLIPRGGEVSVSEGIGSAAVPRPEGKMIVHV